MTYKTSVLTVLVLAFGLAAYPIAADSDISETKAAPQDAVVSIELTSGDVRVTGSSKNEVTVRGEIDGEKDDLKFASASGRVSIKVNPAKGGLFGWGGGGGGELEVSVPKNCRLEISTMSADVDVLDHAGSVQVQTLSGDVIVMGDSKEIEVGTASGDIEIEAPAVEVEIESVSGDVDMEGPSGTVIVSTVSGDLSLKGVLDSGEFQTTSGHIQFEGSLNSGARLQINSLSGGVDLFLPRDVSAEFTVSTFSGDITNQFGPKATKQSDYAPGKALTFSAGGGNARVEIQSFSGEVRLIKR